ncbi:hypothetical protein CR51_20855 [Caballeronia megalochromosomata]|jgi:hypothetical protein|nr:hypothetical protein CR51_20855 [Caballeronia megalochromosomata]
MASNGDIPAALERIVRQRRDAGRRIRVVISFVGKDVPDAPLGQDGRRGRRLFPSQASIDISMSYWMGCRDNWQAMPMRRSNEPDRPCKPRQSGRDHGEDRILPSRSWSAPESFKLLRSDDP